MDQLQGKLHHGILAGDKILLSLNHAVLGNNPATLWEHFLGNPIAVKNHGHLHLALGIG